MPPLFPQSGGFCAWNLSGTCLLSGVDRGWQVRQSSTTTAHPRSPLRVARLAHAGDGGPDFIAQQGVEVVANATELLGEHEIR